MPNECENDLTIQGSKEEIARFRKHAQDGDEPLATGKFIPYPKEFDELWEKDRSDSDKVMSRLKGTDDAHNYGYNKGGYEWCCEHWGTKWGIYEAVLQVDEPEELHYSFTSAWSPPIPVIKKMGEMFPTLAFVFHYAEPGMGFQGDIRIEGGKILEESQRHLSMEEYLDG